MDAFTAATRIGGAAGFTGAWLAAPSLRDAIGDGGLGKLQLGAAGVALAGSTVELVHHSLGSYVRPMWRVAADEGISKGWELLGLGPAARVAGLATAMAAGGAVVGIGFGSARGEES
jgi:hypothetical protein